jgi:histidinol dehydrogenase
MIKYIENPDAEMLKLLLQRPVVNNTADESAVAIILEDVKNNGDAAVRKFTEKFDGCSLQSNLITEQEIFNAYQLVSPELKEAIETAKANIERFHQAQHVGSSAIETMPGVRCWRKSVPIETVGLYIPGGSAPLFSTVLMLAVPAFIAGCNRIVLCTPPDKNGNVNPAILYAASTCGVSEIYKVGGVQAIAAMYYGTETIPQVNKICGPGNSWVTMAKQLIAKNGFPIDIPAGPSELAIYCDNTVPAEFIAADLLSQAEHGADSQVLLLSTDKGIIEEVIQALQLQLEDLPRKETAKQALLNSAAVLVTDLHSAMEIINKYAPEHLILACNDAEKIAAQVRNAGSVFIGAWSPESAGDYASGTNHTLPTNGNARGWSGVSLDTFVKKITFQHITREGLNRIGRTVEVMAEAEGLQAHKNAVTIRLGNKSN